MKSGLENLKVHIDEELKEIYVTDELKKATLNNCTSKKSSWVKFAALPAAAVIALILAVNYGSFRTLFIKEAPPAEVSYQNNEEPAPPKLEAYEPQISVTQGSQITITQEYDSYLEPSASASKPQTTAKTPDAAVTQANPPASNQSDGNVSSSSKSTNSSGNSRSSETQGSPPMSVAANPGTVMGLTAAPSLDEQISAAAKHLGGVLLLPQFIPSGYKLVSVSTPDWSAELKYSSSSSFFTVSESAKTADAAINSGKKISLNNYFAYVSVENSIVKVTWQDDKLKYIVSGNLNEDLLVNIAKSIK